MALDTGDKLLQALAHLSGDLRPQIPRIHYNLARAHRAMRHSTEMYVHLQTAIDMARTFGLGVSFRVKTHQLMSWWKYLDERIAEADHHFQAAAELVDPDDTERVRDQLLLTCLRAYQTGNSKEALNLVEEFLTPGTPTTMHQAAWAHMILAWLALDNGQLEHAWVMVDASLDYATKLRWSEMINRCAKMRQEITRRKESAG